MSEPSVTSAAVSLLRRAGIAITSGGRLDWTLRLPDGTHQTVRVKTYSRNPSVGALEKMQAGHPQQRMLLVLDSPSPQLEDYARHDAIDVVNVRSGTIIVKNREWTRREISEEIKRTAKPAWGRWGLMRALYLSQTPRTQSELAAFVGISQPAVSLILRNLPQVEHDDRGWRATDKQQLLRTWRDTYAGPGGTSTYWYGLADVSRQAADAGQVASELQIEHLATGDTAADEYAPWRLPVRAHLYLDEIVDFSVMNLTPADPADATLVATVPDDPTLWHTARIVNSSPTIADPLIVFWDVLNSAGPDVQEAAAKVLEAIPR
jgi:hypothetical protein